MKHLKYQLPAALATLAGSSIAHAQAMCPVSHCSQIDATVTQLCMTYNLPIGTPFVVIGPTGGTCTCPCSCVTGDTMLALADGASTRIDKLSEGAALHNPHTDDEAPVDKVMFSKVVDYPFRRWSLPTAQRWSPAGTTHSSRPTRP